MCRGLIGKKLGMTGIFSAEGEYLPVTVIELGPCVVTQIKTKASDGYDALQLGFSEKKITRVNKPMKGHFQKSGEKCFKVVKEVRIENAEKYSPGQVITIPECFQVGEYVDITGTTKGRGFTGVVKRHGFKGGPDTHGSMSHRVPGSIGSSAWPSRVVKGKRLPGHYGNELRTIQNLQVVAIRAEDNLILLKGAIPGPDSGTVMIKKAIKSKKNKG